MFRVRGYTTRQLLSQSDRTLVHLADAHADGGPVVLKVPVADEPDRQTIGRYRHEFEILQELDSPRIVDAVELVSDDRSVALVLRHTEGAQSLHERLRGEPLTLREVLTLALELTAALADVHAGRVAHLDINPRNILVDPELGRVTLIDFGVACRLDRPQGVEARGRRGTLAYMSPEQTGRLGRRVDHRSDYYGLGATLYQMLAGAPPFQAESALELVHAHLARPPTPLDELVPGVPPGVAALVGRLLSKSADARYQGTAGLERDLRRCLDDYERTGTVALFPLGEGDPPARMTLLTRLYGRDAELSQLLGAGRRAARGQTQLTTVAGSSGVGKSALVLSAWESLRLGGARLAMGKCDQYDRTTPLGPFLQALRDVVRQLAAAPEEELKRRTLRLKEALGGNARLMTEVLPELEWLIGEQSPVPDVGAADARHRFTETFVKLVCVFGEGGRSLILFLDDLQWADGASLEMLARLAREDVRDQHLFLLGAYRTDEVDVNHPLSLVLERISETGFDVDQLVLGPLSETHTRMFVRDAVFAAPGFPELARVTHQRTGGNPFYIGQFLLSLAAEGQLRLDPAIGSWTWDAAEMAQWPSTANVVEILVRRLGRLPAKTQEMLRIAACVGARFDAESLAVARGVDVDDVRASLERAVADGFITRTTDDYRFVHDRVQQAAYTTLGEERLAVHLAIGRHLRDGNPTDRLGDRTFEIVHHLSIAAGLLEPAEQLPLARLNLAAGLRAKASTAYSAAVQHFERAREGLRIHGSVDQFDLSLQITSSLAESRYLSGEFELARVLFDEALAQAVSDLDRAALFRTLITLETHQAHHGRAMDLMVRSLEMFGVHLRRNPPTRDVVADLLRAKARIGFKSTDVLAEAPEATDPAIRMCVDTMLSATPAIYQAGDQNLLAVVAFRCVALNLQHGNVPASGYSYAVYGMLIGAILGQHRQGRAFGELGISLFDQYHYPEMSCRCHMIFGAFIQPWSGPLLDSIQYLKRGYLLGLESGNLIFAGYTLFFETLHHLHAGSPFSVVNEVCARADLFLGGIKDATIRFGALQLGQVAATLSDEGRDQLDLVPPGFEDAAGAYEASSGTMQLSLWVHRMMVAWMLGRTDLALEAAEEANARLEAGLAALLAPVDALYSSLVYCRHWPEASADERRRYRRSIGKSIRQLAGFARSCPSTFEHQRQIVVGEWACVRGKPWRAIGAFDRAIEGAVEGGFLQHEAIANEQAMAAATSLGLVARARAYRAAAASAYRRWGATRKAALLAGRDVLGGVEGTATGHDSTSGRGDLDVEAITEAWQALSREVVLERLIATLMRIAVTTAGAQRGVLVRMHDDEPRVEAVFQVGPDEGVTAPQPLDASAPLSLGVVHYVLRTGESVVLDEASADRRFGGDPYIVASRPRSVLCAPLESQGRVDGAIYLENNLAAGAFPEHRVELLQALMGQASISLDNAELYGRLTEAVQERARTEESQRRLLQILEVTPDLVAIADRGGRLQYLNSAGRALLGLGPEESIQDRTLEELHTPDAATHLRTEALPDAIRTGLWSGESTFRSAAGEDRVMLQQLLTRGDADGDVEFVATVARDISEHVEFERRLQRAGRLESVGRLASGVAHDINNMLGAILGYAELLQAESAEESRAARFSGQIVDATERGADLVSRLLAFSRRQARSVVPMDLHDSVEQAMALLARTLDPSVVVEMELHAESSTVLGDRSTVESAIVNLAINAADAMPTGGTLRLRTSNVELDVKAAAEFEVEPGPYIEFVLSDTGTGMDEATLDLIFEPFFTTKELGKGTGLGLASVYGTIRSHNGAIVVASTVGRGTDFRVLLPLHDSPVAAGAPVTESRTHSGGRILLVDDDDFLRGSTALLLERLGYEVQVAAGGREALDMYVDHGEEIDLILLDLSMPEVTGRDVLHAVRAVDRDAVVLIMSGHVFDLGADDLDEADRPNGVLEKPFTVRELSEQLARCLAEVRRPERPGP